MILAHVTETLNNISTPIEKPKMNIFTGGGSMSELTKNIKIIPNAFSEKYITNNNNRKSIYQLSYSLFGLILFMLIINILISVKEIEFLEENYELIINLAILTFSVVPIYNLIINLTYHYILFLIIVVLIFCLFNFYYYKKIKKYKQQIEYKKSKAVKRIIAKKMVVLPCYFFITASLPTAIVFHFKYVNFNKIKAFLDKFLIDPINTNNSEIYLVRSLLEIYINKTCAEFSEEYKEIDSRFANKETFAHFVSSLTTTTIEKYNSQPENNPFLFTADQVKSSSFLRYLQESIKT